MKYSAAAARRVASVSPLSCQTSTQARNDERGYPRRHRLTRGLDFQIVIREGKRIRTVHLDVRILASPLGISRIGIVVPRHRNSAVDRNRLKRRLKELARLALLPVLRGVAPTDVAIRARREAYAATFEQLERDIGLVVARAQELPARDVAAADASAADASGSASGGASAPSRELPSDPC